MLSQFKQILGEFDRTEILREDEISKKFIPSLWIKKLDASIGTPEEVREGIKTLTVLKTTIRKVDDFFVKVDGKPFALVVGDEMIVIRGHLAVVAEDEGVWVWGKTSGFTTHKRGLTEPTSRIRALVSEMELLPGFDLNSMENYGIDVYSVRKATVGSVAEGFGGGVDRAVADTVAYAKKQGGKLELRMAIRFLEGRLSEEPKLQALFADLLDATA